MTHKDDIARAFRRAYPAALAVCVVELQAMTNPFQDTFRAVDAAGVALVTNATRQAARGLCGIFEPQVYLVERRAPLGQFE